MADRISKKPARPPREPVQRQPPAPEPDLDGFPVVAVGASAGGLHALRQFIAAVPVDCGMAFVLVQHLDPTHTSLMADLLATHTALPVQQAEDGMRVERDHVYTMPPGAYLAIRGGNLELTRPIESHGVRLPFDFFLRSLAQDLGERAVCVVLSGAGTDGSLGLRAVKEHNGLVIVQDPVEAEHDGMPRSAILTEAVDRILPAGEIAAALVAYGRGRRVEKARDRSPAEEAGGDDLEAIVTLLRTRTAHDFRLYKTGTLQRRVHRRRVMSGVPDNARYLDLLRQDSRELEHLAKDLLINVTNFFRDPMVFDFLAERVIPDLIRRHDPDEPIRVWVAGCSTGEEPYSIAMLVFEEMARLGVRHKLQVFASDVDADAIVAAREGLYPESIASDVSPERLERFFTKEDHHYRVIPDLRAAVIFAVHDILADPPFARLDLISCRNLLIYLTVEAQDKILRLFHFSLRDGGKLLLGSSETVGKLGDRFRAVSKSQRVYARVGYLRPGEVDFPIKVGGRAALRGIQEPVKPSAAARLGELARGALLDAYAPPSALINERHEVLYYLGETDRYLRVTPGQPSRDLLLMAREGLRSKLRIALRAGGAAEAARRRRRADDAGRRHDRGEHLRPADPGRRRDAVPRQLRRSAAGAAPVRRDGAECRRPVPAVGSRARTREHPLRTGERRPRAGAVERRATRHQRGGAVGQRGVAGHQRGADDLEGGAAVPQRGAGRPQQPASGGARRPARRRQRPAEHPVQRRRGDAVPGQRPQHPVLHAGGQGAFPDHRHRHRPAARRPDAAHPRRHPARRSPRRAGAQRADALGDRGFRGRLVRPAHHALPHARRPGRRRAS